jgi:hypothetical protein
VCEQPTPSGFRFAVFTVVWVDDRWVVERRRLNFAYRAALAELTRDAIPTACSR